MTYAMKWCLASIKIDQSSNKNISIRNSNLLTCGTVFHLVSMYQDMEVYYIILLCLVTEIVSQDPDNLLSEEKAICGNRYYFLNERYTYNEANSRCQELGYDGLAVVITLEQRDLVYDILSKESLASEVWLAYEYHPVRLEWGWKRGGVWLNKTSQYSPEWFEGEPNFLYSQRIIITIPGSQNESLSDKS
ncbi:hypothetical protein LOTGIDRAFT_164022 [Lottia gigantea]|uniref:C-type lectin domain-containing protein n=1 Tax=Lottia gigantea TaxID=225164 RepID=V4A621_LOTGI|nr:hypothetical protein LOTGIDRAFT_164022 [Lottia gigantea]ESO90440.1 hypothetical protein LOTGIDRAFT_164022 [Lottia gigantea]